MVAFLFLTATVARQMVTITTPIKTIRNVARSPITSPSVFPVPELPINVKFVFSVGVVISRDERISNQYYTAYCTVSIVLLTMIPVSMQHRARPCRRVPVSLQLMVLNPALLNRLLAILH